MVGRSQQAGQLGERQRPVLLDTSGLRHDHLAKSPIAMGSQSHRTGDPFLKPDRSPSRT
jgi:hypothetical protein